MIYIFKLCLLVFMNLMRFSKILIVLCALIFSFWLNYSDAWIFDEENPTIPYEQECSWDDCLREWINATSWIWAIETKRKSSEYLQDVVIYSITFLTLLAVIYSITFYIHHLCLILYTNLSLRWWKSKKI